VTLRLVLRSPLFWILAAAGALRLTGLFWGLPASDGWDDDGFAPRNFLTALALTYKPGSYFTYPPLHAFILAIFTLPGSLIALSHVTSWTQSGVVGEFTKPPYMTFFAVTARLVSIAMSLGIIAGIGQMAELIAGRRAGFFAAGACALGVGLTYYGQVTNLDVPYLFWCALSLLWWMRGIARQEPARFRLAILFAAAAVATKDQAYAVFLLSIPAILLLWFQRNAWPRANARQILIAILLPGLVAILLLLLLDGAVTNPYGFASRLAFLAGPASQGFADYQNSAAGRFALLKDATGYFTQGYSALVCILALLGLAFALLRSAKPVQTAALLPFAAMLSFTLCFNLVALRTDVRFLLPQAVLAAVYVGIAADRLTFAPQARSRFAARFALAIIAFFALYRCLSVDMAFLEDPRYDAESWIAAHVRPGGTIETYGQNAYLPRLPQSAVSWRVGPGALAVRNPLPHVTELMQPFGAIESRKPRFIIVSDWWVQRYLGSANTADGHILSPILQSQYADADARAYFARLYGGALPYRMVHRSRYAGRFFPPIHIHESLDESIDIFERRP
jgi:4-amino-4-deoxy-L-arabinose transferase-like glycosyltransferase